MPDIEKEYFIYFYIELIIGLISLIRSSDTAASCDKKCRLDPISFNFAAQGYHQRHPPVLFLGTTLYLSFFVFFFYHCICLCACFFLFSFLSLIRSRSTLRCTAITNGIVFKNTFTSRDWFKFAVQGYHQCTMCILGTTMALWSKAEIQKYTF